MAPITCVVVLTPHGRRVNIKVESNTTLMKILEDVCQKYEFLADDYDLKHHNKVLDLNTQIRYSGLPNNASLEMYPVAKKRTESNVVILVQTESGSRHTGTFLPSDTVWHVVSNLCGDLVAGMNNPVLIFTRTELYGQDKMQNTTLKMLGLTGGRAMFRLLDRSEEQLRQQANVSAPIPRAPAPPSPPPIQRKPPAGLDLIKAAKSSSVSEPKSEEPVAGPSWASDVSGSSTISPLSSTAPKKTKLECSTAPQPLPDIVHVKQEEIDKEIEKELVSLGERDAVVFNRLASNPQQTSDDLPEDFFELSLEDAKRLLRDLRNKREEMENCPIQTSAMRELEENKHKLMLLQKYRHTVLRIYFPNAIVLQAAFKPVESVDAVYEFVRKQLQNRDGEFELYTAPPRRVLQREERLIEIGLVPGAIIHFSSTSDTNLLKQELLDSLSSPAAALLAARRSKTN